MNKICIGLDLEKNSSLFTYYNIINQTKSKAFCYKLNPAYFMENNVLFKKVVNYLNENNIKWIYDGKLGDVLHTNEYYAEYVYSYLKASGVTLNPYVGIESLMPFTKYKNKMNFLLCRTTNIGSDLLQKESYKKVYFMSKKLNSGLVVAGNKEDLIKDAIKNCKKQMILCPGIGAQGGKINKQISKENIIYSISRSIINSKNPEKELEKYVS